jgi:hypothetical protein
MPKKRWGNKTLWSVLGAFAVATLLWNTPVIYPLKILVVFFHEISHVAVGLLAGATEVKITLSVNEGGRAWANAGSQFLMANAGYLGSMLWGGGIVLAAAYTDRDRFVTSLLGLVLGYVTVRYVRNSFGFGFGLAAAASLLAAGKWLPDEANDFLLKVIGTTSMGYAVLDVYSDVISRSCVSDATILANMTGVPRLVWGGLWIVLSLAGIYGTLVLAARAERRA